MNTITSSNTPGFRPILPRPPQRKEAVPVLGPKQVPIVPSQQSALPRIVPTVPSTAGPKGSSSSAYFAAPGAPKPIPIPKLNPNAPPQATASLTALPSQPMQCCNPFANQFRNFIDNAVRASAERVTSELVYFRSLFLQVVIKENQEKEKWKGHCVTFKQERDVARERVRQLMAERELLLRHGLGDGTTPSGAPLGAPEPQRSARRDVFRPTKKGIKRARESQDSVNETQSGSASPVLSPKSPHFSVQLPTPTSPQHTFSMFSFPADPEGPKSKKNLARPQSSPTGSPKRSRRGTPNLDQVDLEDKTDHDGQARMASPVNDQTSGSIAIKPELPEMEPPSKRRRSSSCSAASSETAIDPLDGWSPTIEQIKLGSLELEEGELMEVVDETEEVLVTDPKDSTGPSSIQAILNPHSQRRRSMSVAEYVSPKSQSTAVPNDGVSESLFIPIHDQLICRICLQHRVFDTSRTSKQPAGYPMNTPSNVLRDHYTNEHPQMCLP